MGEVSAVGVLDAFKSNRAQYACYCCLDAHFSSRVGGIVQYANFRAHASYARCRRCVFRASLPFSHFLRGVDPNVGTAIDGFFIYPSVATSMTSFI